MTFQLQAFEFEFDSQKRIHRSSGAIIVDQYRYRLWRSWSLEPWVVWIMLNPSTADASRDDQTIRKCILFSKTWGFGGLEVLNLFALRATDPRELKPHSDPVGPENDRYIAEVVRGMVPNAAVVAAWGCDGALRGRGEAVRSMFRQWRVPLMHLGLTKDGHPKHPLYLAKNTNRQIWEAP